MKAKSQRRLLHRVICDEGWLQIKTARAITRAVIVSNISTLNYARLLKQSVTLHIHLKFWTTPSHDECILYTYTKEGTVLLARKVCRHWVYNWWRNHGVRLGRVMTSPQSSLSTPSAWPWRVKTPQYVMWWCKYAAHYREGGEAKDWTTRFRDWWKIWEYYESLLINKIILISKL